MGKGGPDVKLQPFTPTSLHVLDVVRLALHGPLRRAHRPHLNVRSHPECFLPPVGCGVRCVCRYLSEGDGAFVAHVGDLVLGSADELQWVKGLLLTGTVEGNTVTGKWASVASAPPVVPLKVSVCCVGVGSVQGLVLGWC